MFVTTDKVLGDKPVQVYRGHGERQVILDAGNYVGKPCQVENHRYVVGVWNEEKKCFKEFHEAPLVQFQLASSLLKRKNVDKSLEARNELGRSFGSKKKKLEIRQATENKVTADSVHLGVQNAVLGKLSQVVPAQASTEDDANEERELLPRFNKDASSVAEAYDIESICPLEELKSINIKQIVTCKYREDLQKMLVKVHSSEWVLDRIHATLQAQTGAKRIKMLIYLLYLMRFSTVKEQAINKNYERYNLMMMNGTSQNNDNNGEEDGKSFAQPHFLSKVMGYAPPAVIDSFLARFTETVTVNGGSSEEKVTYKISAKLKDKLLCYALCLALSLDEYQLEFGSTGGSTSIHKDFSLTIPRITSLLKELGCRIERGSGTGSKRAVLSVPLCFPKRTR